jgi:hypothetical protein
MPPPQPRGGPEHFGGGRWPHVDEPGAYFYEDSGSGGWGESLFCRPNRGYWDLTEVGRGILGLGDWNDVVSAFQGHEVQIVVLYEHVNMTGDSLTDHYSASQLDYLGWNDRASSVATW